MKQSSDPQHTRRVREVLFYHIKSATRAPPTQITPSHARAPDNKHIHLAEERFALRRLARLGSALTHHCLDNLLLLNQECANDAAAVRKRRGKKGKRVARTHIHEHTLHAARNVAVDTRFRQTHRCPTTTTTNVSTVRAARGVLFDQMVMHV